MYSTDFTEQQADEILEGYGLKKRADRYVLQGTSRDSVPFAIEVSQDHYHPHWWCHFRLRDSNLVATAAIGEHGMCLADAIMNALAAHHELANRDLADVPWDEGASTDGVVFEVLFSAARAAATVRRCADRLDGRPPSIW